MNVWGEPGRCSRCGELRPASDFGRKGRQCRSCRAAYNRAWRDGHRDRWPIYWRRWYDRRRANPEWQADRRLAQRLRYLRRRGEVLAVRKAFYRANRRRILARIKARYWAEKRKRQGEG